MNIKAWNALLVIALLIVLAGGGYILNEDHKRKQAAIEKIEAEEQAKAEEAARIKAEELAAKKQEFEDFLNAFLKDVYAKMQEYRQARKVVDNLDKPSNLTKAEYARENAVFAEQTIMDLELQMGEIMLSFQQADVEAEPLIEKFDEEDQAAIRSEWEKVHAANSEQFTQFFSMDQDILRAQLELLQFYAEHSDGLFVNLNRKLVMFEDRELNKQANVLKSKVEELKKLRKDILTDQAN
jgi:outer membrane murein-binding lipoprotein Lpp